MAARAVEAGDIVLDEGDEKTDEHGAMGEPWRVDPNNGSQLGGEEQEIESANDGDAASQAGFFKEPVGDGIRLPVQADKTPSADHIERLRPKQGDGRANKECGFRESMGLEILNGGLAARGA